MVSLAAYAAACGPIGIAASTAVVYRSPKKKKSRAAFDAAGRKEFDGHCVPASLLYAWGNDSPSLADIRSLRACLADVWRRCPLLLKLVSARADRTPEAYTCDIGRDLWLGTPDIYVLSLLMHTAISIEDGQGRCVWQTPWRAKNPIVLVWTGTHYYVKRRNQHIARLQVHKRLLKLAARQLCKSAQGGATCWTRAEDEVAHHSKRGGAGTISASDKQEEKQEAASSEDQGQPADAAIATAQSSAEAEDKSDEDTPKRADTMETHLRFYPDLVLNVQNWHYCTLCLKWLDGMHVNSKPHKAKLAKWWAQSPSQRMQAAISARQYAIEVLKEQEKQQQDPPATVVDTDPATVQTAPVVQAKAAFTGPAMKAPAVAHPAHVTEALARQQQYWEAIFAQVTDKYLRAMPPTTAMALAIASQAHAKAGPACDPKATAGSIDAQSLQMAAGQGGQQSIPAKARPQKVSQQKPPLERKRKTSQQEEADDPANTPYWIKCGNITLRPKALVVPPMGPPPSGVAASTRPGDEVSFPKSGQERSADADAAAQPKQDERPPLQRKKRERTPLPRKKKKEDDSDHRGGSSSSPQLMETQDNTEGIMPIHRGGAPKRSSTSADMPESKVEEVEVESPSCLDDTALASELYSALASQHPVTEHDSASSEGYGRGWWVVVCVYATRILQARMHEHAMLEELAASVGLALKWPTKDVVLLQDGHPIPLDIPLVCLEPPYQFGVVSVHCVGNKRKVGPAKREPTLQIDLGDVQPTEELKACFLSRTQGQGGQESAASDRGPGGAASSSSDPLPDPDLPTPQQEAEGMRRNDCSVGVITVKRPRDVALHQFRVGANIGDLLTAHSRAKKMKKDAYTIYEAIYDHDRTLYDGMECYLTWQQPSRGGSSTVSTTESCNSGGEASRSTADHEMDQAKRELNEIEHFLFQVRMASIYLQAFRRQQRSPSPKIIALADWCQKRKDLRGGTGKERTPPTKWETTQTNQGLLLRTEIQTGERKAAVTQLETEKFAPGACGYALLSWESWEQQRQTESDRLLIAIVPGPRKQQVLAYGLHEDAAVRECDIILKTPTTGSEQKQHYFAKKVTMVTHMPKEKLEAYQLVHHGQQIKLQPQHAHEILVDLYEQDASSSQAWTTSGMKATISTGLRAWNIYDTINVQWPTLRYHAETSRATVLVRCGDPQRIVMLRKSGTSLLYTRERESC